MDLPTTAVKVRAALTSAGGQTISASRAQDLLFDLYKFADDTTGPEVEAMLTWTLGRGNFLSSELEGMLAKIEASANN